MATDDLFGVPKYSDGYVWNFKVTKGEGTATVGVKAVAIDKTLYVTEIGTAGTGKLVTDSGVISYVAQEIAKYGKLELKVVSELPTAGEATLGAIYLVSKGKGKTGYREYITVKGGTEASPSYAWEEIGDTDVDLEDYVKNTDYATSAKGGVIKSSDADGKISVGTDGIASLNGYDDLAKSDDLDDYYKMSAAEKEAGTGTLLSEDDKTKLDGITPDATKAVITNTEAEKKITVTDKDGNETVLTIPEAATAAYDTIKVVGDTTSITTASNGTTVVFEQGDGIKLTPGSDTTGNPAIKISVDTIDVIDIATTIPADTSKDTAIPNVGAVKAYVDGHKGSSPSYNPTDGSIDLTV